MEEKINEEEKVKDDIDIKKNTIISISTVLITLILSLIAFIIVLNIPSTSSRLIKYFIYLGVSIINVVIAFIAHKLTKNIKNLVEPKKAVSNLTTGISLGVFFAVAFCLIPLIYRGYPFGSSLTLSIPEVMLMIAYYLAFALFNTLTFILLLQDNLELLNNKLKYIYPILTALLITLIAFFFNGSFNIYLILIFITGLVYGYQRLLFKTQTLLSFSSSILVFYIFIMIIRLVLI